MATTTRPPTVIESRGFACERFATMAFSHEPAWRHRSRKSRRKDAAFSRSISTHLPARGRTARFAHGKPHVTPFVTLSSVRC